MLPNLCSMSMGNAPVVAVTARWVVAVGLAEAPAEGVAVGSAGTVAEAAGVAVNRAAGVGSAAGVESEQAAITRAAMVTSGSTCLY